MFEISCYLRIPQGRQSSVDLSVNPILRPWVWIPSTLYELFHDLIDLFHRRCYYLVPWVSKLGTANWKKRNLARIFWKINHGHEEQSRKGVWNLICLKYSTEVIPGSFERHKLTVKEDWHVPRIESSKINLNFLVAWNEVLIYNLSSSYFHSLFINLAPPLMLLSKKPLAAKV